MFLDTIASKKEKRFDIAWHLKDTNTGIYTPAFAYAPKRYRLAAMRSLFYRALRINSNRINYQNSVSTIKGLFLKNGFSEQTIDNVRNEVEVRLAAPEPKTDTTKFINWSFPFIASSENNLRSHIKNINKDL